MVISFEGGVGGIGMMDYAVPPYEKMRPAICFHAGMMPGLG